MQHSSSFLQLRLSHLASQLPTIDIIIVVVVTIVIIIVFMTWEMWKRGWWGLRTDHATFNVVLASCDFPTFPPSISSLASSSSFSTTHVSRQPLEWWQTKFWRRQRKIYRIGSPRLSVEPCTNLPVSQLCPYLLKYSIMLSHLQEINLMVWFWFNSTAVKVLYTEPARWFWYVWINSWLCGRGWYVHSICAVSLLSQPNDVWSRPSQCKKLQPA